MKQAVPSIVTGTACFVWVIWFHETRESKTLRRGREKRSDRRPWRAYPVGTEKSGTRLSTNLFAEKPPPIGWLLVDVPFFGVETDISASSLACHQRREPVFLFPTTMFAKDEVFFPTD